MTAGCTYFSSKGFKFNVYRDKWHSLSLGSRTSNTKRNSKQIAFACLKNISNKVLDGQHTCQSHFYPSMLESSLLSILCIVKNNHRVYFLRSERIIILYEQKSNMSTAKARLELFASS